MRSVAGRLVAAVTALAAVSVLLAGCGGQASQEGGQDGRPDAPEGAPAPHGCYSLAAEGDGADGARLPPGALPRMLQLDTVVAGTVRVEPDGDRPAYRAYTYLGTRRADHPFNRWTHLPGDSVRVDHSGALAGVVLRLAAADSVMKGTARGFTDVGIEGEGRSRAVPVRATPAACPGSGP